MTPDKLPAALHGFLKACGLSVSRGDDGGIGLDYPGGDADTLNNFLDAPLRTHLVASKPGILSLIDAEPVAGNDDDAQPGDDDDALCTLAAQSDLVSWKDAVRVTVGRVALRKWQRHCSQSRRAGLRAQDQQSFVDAETRRLLRVCNL
jgi:hypothetical protein